MDAKDLQQLTEKEQEELLEAETEMFSHYFVGAAEDKKPGQITLLIAIFAHLFVLYVTMPSFKISGPPPKPEKIVFVQKWRPPPPPQKEPPKPIKERKLKTKKIPIPDPTPEEPEPIKEPEPEPELEPLPPDAIALIGIPDLPPVANTGPLIAGTLGVTNPVRTVHVEPTYPRLARQAGVQGIVILQLVVFADGTVGQIEVLQTNAPDLGFEESAIEAVQQWRYKPGEQNGRAVTVWYTVTVRFVLH